MRLIPATLQRKLLVGTIAVIAVVSPVLPGWAPARAAPPTVTPSPGYDARLAERRAAQAATAVPQSRRSHLRHSRELPRNLH